MLRPVGPRRGSRSVLGLLEFLSSTRPGPWDHVSAPSPGPHPHPLVGAARRVIFSLPIWPQRLPARPLQPRRLRRQRQQTGASRCLETWLGVALSHGDNEHFLASWAVPSPGELLALGAGWGRAGVGTQGMVWGLPAATLSKFEAGLTNSSAHKTSSQDLLLNGASGAHG